MDPAAAGSGIFNSPIANTGAGLADMLLGDVDYADLNQYPRFYTRQSDYAGYLNDNWRIGRRLTLNLGLRYEYWTPFSDKRDQASTLNLNASGGPAVVYAGASPVTKQGLPQDVASTPIKRLALRLNPPRRRVTHPRYGRCKATGRPEWASPIN